MIFEIQKEHMAIAENGDVLPSFDNMNQLFWKINEIVKYCNDVERGFEHVEGEISRVSR